MSATLIGTIGLPFAKAADFKVLFDEVADEITAAESARQQPKFNVPGTSCNSELFFGFFFDGTKNSYLESDTPRPNGSAKLNHSNVARLYGCFPGLSVPGVLPTTTDWDYKPQQFTHFFRVYVPGVARPFKEIKDTAEGIGGGAFGAGGEARIVWALIQAINNLHRYFRKAPLIDGDAASQLARRIVLNRQRLAAMRPSTDALARAPEDLGTRVELVGLLQHLYTSLALHVTDKTAGQPAKVDPGIVTKINISIFGFSRGSAQARAFANWLMALCALDAKLRGSSLDSTLAGFPVEFTFMGLFDTVASVGFANTFGNASWLPEFDGHGGYADSDQSLRISDRIPCLHLVAAHEVRRSFPLESASVGNALPSQCKEIVFPGVHSDLGGAYCPREQGRGVDEQGADMISRIPLITMYRAARLAGVPLKLEVAKPVVKQRFSLTPATIQAFNAYLAQCKVQKGELTAIMREQRRLCIQWKVLRRRSGAADLQNTEAYRRASTFDQNDLNSANLEFENELAAFEAWQNSKGSAFVAHPQPAGFGDVHEREWEEIATWWPRRADLHPDVITFFDNHVHDSHAWFKVNPVSNGGTPDSEEELAGLLTEWLRRYAAVVPLPRRGDFDQLTPGHQRALINAESDRRLRGAGLTSEQLEAAQAFARTGKIPRMAAPGREPFAYARAGYLRYRKIYAGADKVLLSAAPTPRVPATV